MRPYLSHSPNISLRVPSFTRLWIISSAFLIRLSHCMNATISFLSAGFAWYRLAFHSPFPINHFRVSSARICDCCVGVHTSVLDWYDNFASGVRFCSVVWFVPCWSSCASSCLRFTSQGSFAFVFFSVVSIPESSNAFEAQAKSHLLISSIIFFQAG